LPTFGGAGVLKVERHFSVSPPVLRFNFVEDFPFNGPSPQFSELVRRKSGCESDKAHTNKPSRTGLLVRRTSRVACAYHLEYSIGVATVNGKPLVDAYWIKHGGKNPYTVSA
jgi:hypothetical protein